MLATLSSDIKVYEQRNPKQSQFYKCVEDHFERLENIGTIVIKSFMVF